MPGYARNPDAIEDDLYVFVDEAARDASLPSPITGTLVYISSLDEYQYYDGSDWAALGGGGSSSTTAVGGAGSENTGSGGAGAVNSFAGGAGGSGVVIIRHLSNKITATTTGSPTVTTSGGYTIYTFTSSGTIRW